MKYFFAGGLIWIKTLFLGAFFLGFGGLLMNDWSAFGISVIVFGVGIFITAPLLLIIIPLVKLSIKIPYSIPARMAWLVFYLALIVIGFYALLIASDVWSQNDLDFVTASMYATLAGLLAAVYTTRKRLTKLNNENI